MPLGDLVVGRTAPGGPVDETNGPKRSAEAVRRRRSIAAEGLLVKLPGWPGSVER